ncbi:MAG TPA: VWA domain-containing protein, partial [Candidatus Angelobacter sp.]|nr:VWA domain-containing protein [Candidatus Angelobacter sp.]
TCCLIICCLAAFVLLGMSAPRMDRAQSSSQQNPSDDIYKIRVNTNLVVLHASVEDHKGVSVSGLDKNNFQVSEDGVLQPIKYFSHQDIPVTVGLVIDNSGSMTRKRSDVIAAALAFARSSNPQDQMFVVNFNEYVSFALPENTPFTDKGSELEAALSKIHTVGKTALYDAMAVAMEHLKKGNRDKKVLIVISDGGDNASKVSNLTQIIAMAQRTETIIYTIGLFDEDDDYRNPGVLKQLAQNTGGDVFLPASIKEVVPICEQIAHDVRNQYTIAYVPTNTKQNGMFRAIHVKVVNDGRNLMVKTRPGYRAPLAQFSEATKRSLP